MDNIENYKERIFEDIKHTDEFGNEYWLARELQYVLEYRQWRSINDLIEKAKVACKESKYNVYDHFAVERKMVDIGSKIKRKVLDYKLSRYACYLIAQTDAKLKRDNVDNEYTANSVHFEVGREVRNSIKRLGGTMPEDLPTPEKTLKELEKDKQLKI